MIAHFFPNSFEFVCIICLVLVSGIKAVFKVFYITSSEHIGNIHSKPSPKQQCLRSLKTLTPFHVH